MVDMEDDSEKLASVLVGGRLLGECNPSPESDFSCNYFDCFDGEDVPLNATISGFLTIEAHSVRTHDDCHCSQEVDWCYNKAIAQLFGVEGQALNDPSYGMFVKFTLTPDHL